MPLSFERFQGDGVFGLSSSIYSDSQKIWFNQNKIGITEEEEVGYVVGGGLPEPTSVLDALRSPSPLTSHSSTTTTLSSSHGGATVTATTTGDDNNKCSQMGLDDLDGVLSASSPTQEQSILRLIMDPGSGFGVFDPGFVFGSGSGSVSGSIPVSDNSNPLLSCSFPFQEISNPVEALINPNQYLFSNPPSSPPAKRFNSGSHHHQQPPVFPFTDPDPRHDPVRRQHQFQFPFQRQQLKLPSSSTVAMVPVSSPGMAGDDQSVIIEQLFFAAELIGTTGNNNNGDHTVLAQGILARLNHHLNSNYNNNNSKPPFQRAASHISEALLSLIHDVSSPLITPENLILRIAAYRSFSEASPFLQFVNFTANQSILESCSESGFDRFHIIDFDVGYGGQWSSLMQELASGGTPGRRGTRASSMKLTVFAPPPSTVSDEFELRFTEENLKTFAGEVKIPFEIELLSLELLLNPAYWPLSLRSSEKEAIAVNLPIGSVVSGYLPLILRFLKQISPNVVVCSDRGFDLNDAHFPNAVIHTLQYHTTLLESLDANQNQDDSSIERFCVQPSIEKLLMTRHCWMERSPPWRSLFTQCGFSPARLSQTAEAQAECLLQRNPVRGFHVEKRQSSLVMCWQRKELVTVSAWKC